MYRAGQYSANRSDLQAYNLLEIPISPVARKEIRVKHLLRPAQLGDAGLVDEYQFVIIPVALGGGPTVFSKNRKLLLLHQRAFRCGNVVITYAA